jgi:hypothetical protein
VDGSPGTSAARGIAVAQHASSAISRFGARHQLQGGIRRVELAGDCSRILVAVRVSGATEDPQAQVELAVGKAQPALRRGVTVGCGEVRDLATPVFTQAAAGLRAEFPANDGDGFSAK